MKARRCIGRVHKFATEAFAPRSLVDGITPDDVTVAVDFKSEPVSPNRFKPEVTLTAAFADKLMVRSIEPATVQVRP